MLLNLSNHPSINWPENQTSTAIEKYGSIQDLPFPAIDPELKEEDLDLLTEEYFAKIIPLQPTAIHIMGELTFTIRLVNRLKSIGIPCIASTTRRNATESGNTKTSIFEFIAFRAY